MSIVPLITSGSVWDVALTRLDIIWLPPPEHSHGDAWVDEDAVRRKLAEHFGKLFEPDGERVIVVTDKACRHYRVANIRELALVWFDAEIAYVFSIPSDVFESIKHELALELLLPQAE